MIRPPRMGLDDTPGGKHYVPQRKKKEKDPFDISDEGSESEIEEEVTKRQKRKTKKKKNDSATEDDESALGSDSQS